jgi:hypothetical protein
MQTLMDFDDLLRAATQCAMTKYPDETRRILRGLEIARSGGVTIEPDGTTLIRSDSKPGTRYQLTQAGCPCIDAGHQAPEGRCKHRWARALTRKARRLQAHGPVPRQYYATYTAPDGQQQGVATWDHERGCYLFVPDDGSPPVYPASQVLSLGGHVPTAEAQREKDGNLGEKFGRPQYPEVDHAAIDASLAERKARRERGWQYGN